MKYSILNKITETGEDDSTLKNLYNGRPFFDSNAMDISNGIVLFWDEDTDDWGSVRGPIDRRIPTLEKENAISMFVGEDSGSADYVYVPIELGKPKWIRWQSIPTSQINVTFYNMDMDAVVDIESYVEDVWLNTNKYDKLYHRKPVGQYSMMLGYLPSAAPVYAWYKITLISGENHTMNCRAYKS